MYKLKGDAKKNLRGKKKEEEEINHNKVCKNEKKLSATIFY